MNCVKKIYINSIIKYYIRCSSITSFTLKVKKKHKN